MKPFLRVAAVFSAAYSALVIATYLAVKAAMSNLGQ